MTRLTRIIFAVLSIFAISALPALADRPASPSKSKAAPHVKAKGIGKGVTKITSGSTKVEFDAATLATLTAAGVALTPVVPATAVGTVFAFPITKGRVHFAKGKKKKLSGYVNHSGGISFAKGAVSATASGLRVHLSASKKVRVFATISTANVRLLNLKDVVVAGHTITANALLSEEAASQLNTALAVTTFTAGLAIGKVTVTPGA